MEDEQLKNSLIPITKINMTLHSRAAIAAVNMAHPAKIDLDKKWLPKQKTIQNFNIDALGFRKTRNENPPTQDIGVTS